MRSAEFASGQRRKDNGSARNSPPAHHSALRTPHSAITIALYNATTTTKVGGVETFVWEVAGRLAARGYRVDVIGGRGRER